MKREKRTASAVGLHRQSGICLVLCLMLLLSAAVMTAAITASANDQKVVDMADLLSQKQEEKLQKQFAKIAETYACDVAVVTTDSCGGKSPQDYTDDYYEQNGYGYGDENDGIMLMVSIGDRKFHLETRGKAIDIFTDYGLMRMDELITEDLHNGDYYDAFELFGKLVKEFIEESEKDQPFDTNHKYEEKMSAGLRFLICAGIGLVVALIVLAVLYQQLRSVSVKHQAQEYVRSGSFHVTRSRDVYLYRTVQKRKIEKSSGGSGGGSTTHTTSGGGRAGGRTGSF